MRREEIIAMNEFLTDPRFNGIEKFSKKVWLSSPTMYSEEQHRVDEAIQTNCVSTIAPISML